MGAIPDSGLPGHRQLHERVVRALDTCQESRDVEFKRSAPWSDLKWGIVRACLAMGNLRDGGIVVIGVAEGDTGWLLEGMTETHIATFSVDDIREKVAVYVSPHVDLDVVTVLHGDARFLAIQIREFRESPLVCKKNGPDKEGITEGRVYVRPAGAARTTAVTHAEQMHDLLDLAAEKRARRLLEASKRIGLTMPEPEDEAKFQQELDGL